MKKTIGIFIGLCLLAGLAEAQSEEALRAGWRAHLLAPLTIRGNTVTHDDIPAAPSSNKPASPLGLDSAPFDITEYFVDFSTHGRNYCPGACVFYPSSMWLSLYETHRSDTEDSNASIESALSQSLAINAFANLQIGTPLEPFPQEMPPWLLKKVDEDLKHYSLTGGKPPVRKNSPGHFDNIEFAAIWAGPAVKDGVTHYWQDAGKTHIRIPFTDHTVDLYRWASAQGIALQLSRRRNDRPVMYATDPIIIEGRTAIPVFIITPEGLIPSRITVFAIGGEACDKSNWLELELENEATPPVWAVLALSDANWAKSAKVARQPQKETVKENALYLESKRSVLQVNFAADVLPPLTLIARRFEWVEREADVEPEINEGKSVEPPGKVVGSVWGTQLLVRDELYEQERAQWATPAVFGKPIRVLGSPRCPPP